MLEGWNAPIPFIGEVGAPCLCLEKDWFYLLFDPDIIYVAADLSWFRLFLLLKLLPLPPLPPFPSLPSLSPPSPLTD